ncbi:hypothetical protein [Paraburkholderia haematera]|uniref:Uncharacterized protein n=1 Tax=Paraburkholderia haematera TaxID=2793077 RepID=A0ABM8QTI8_9BURK|nr:hypothetical protein [Paraburkholderia haematera]CAE6714333.1 hypothetical protein R69888_01300 [Paraburkholderia haematera]
MSKPTHAQEILASARANLATVAERAEAAHVEHNKRLIRKTEAEARGAEAFRDVRDKKISEEVGAMRVAQANEDAKDLQGLIEQSALLLANLNAEVSRAKAAEHEAEAGARREESEIVATELSDYIHNLEAARTDAVNERHQLYRGMSLNAAAAELLKRVKSLEQEFLETIAKCYDIHVETDPPRSPGSRRTCSVHDFYRPSLALQDVVSQGTKPRF